ncbi:hypothetical protein PAT3040_02941 [Paenibacillus agaridevorans]|uniref:Uncharacterized protein n=1 Tax=Paenibacillus agaridevorans TaxID=171404 RepID=A0A2R5EYB4_9BACL|nr:hypothetical protein [Paenibacillus agaridevorans]GBG08361.1 hypothetical protein PAT3040_02941 [Paenibacillus agaridevorans]
MKKYKILSSICLSFTLLCTSSFSALSAEPLSKEEIAQSNILRHMEQNSKKFENVDSLIDSRITDLATRKKISDSLELIDPSGRENVIIIENDGTILSNKLGSLEEFKNANQKLIGQDGKLINPIVASQELKESNNGQLISGSNAALASTGWKNAEAPCTNDATGPFRRGTTAKGYSRMHAFIQLPGKNQGITIPSSASTSADKAYVYMGAIDKDNAHVDAGVTYNYESGPYYWQESWGMTLAGASPTNNPTFGNFTAGWINMKFYIPSNNKIVLEVTGTRKETNTLQTYTILANVDLAILRNFNSNGSGVTLKRVTSIAQEKGKQNLTSGSTLGTSTNYVYWENVRIGTKETDLSTQSVGYFCGHQTTNVLVDYTNQANEKVRVKTGTLTP